MTSAAPSMKSAKRNVTVLATAQALLLINNATVIAINGLAGYELASDKALATLPVTGWVIGAAISTFPASMLMKRIGRRGGFNTGIFLGLLGAAICSTAVARGEFWLLCLGSMVFGAYNAFGQYYRFAAADASPDDFKSKAISLVLGGGLVGGIVGPELSKITVGALQTLYLGAYLSLMVFLAIAFAVVQLLRVPAPSAAEQREAGRPLAKIAAQPRFIVAVVSAAFGYGVMNLLMTATPLAMGMCGHPYGSAAFVIQWHIVGMFGPSFFTGSLIRRFGLLQILLSGAVLLLLCTAIAISGVTVANFWFALLMLGIGWNFLYIGGTTLLTETYRPSEKAKAQGANDLTIFLTMAISSAASGAVLTRAGWDAVNYLAIPFVVAILLGLFWLIVRRRSAAAA